MIEGLIRALLPGVALRRARARLAEQQLRAAYDAARTSRRTRGWRASSSGPVTETEGALATLRDRSRDMVRNNPWAAGGLRVLVGYQVGDGITARSNTGDAGLDRQVDALWAAWGARCDLHDRLDMGGLQALVARTRAEAGEALVQLVPLPAGEARARAGVPLALSVLEPDYLDETLDRSRVTAAGGVIRQGVELDGRGRRVAYHLRTAHPGETDILTGPGGQTRRVPADVLLHVFRQDRPGQLRGVPDLSAAMTRLRELDELDDALLVQAKVQSMVAAFVTSDAAQARGPLEGTDPATGDPLREMEPGIIERLLPGEDVKFTAPSGSGDFNGLARHHLRAIAQAFGLTYDLLTGDLTEANYSSLRAGRLAFRRRLEADQWLLLVPQLVRPIWEAFTAAAVRAGLLELRADGYPAEFGPPAFEMVDPLKDAEGIRLMRRMGLMTRAQAIAEQGWDPRRQIEELAAENAQADRLGLILDDDPRRVAGTGAAQDAAQNAAVQLRSGQGDTA